MKGEELLTRIKAHQQMLKLPNLQLSYLEWNRGQEPLLLLHGMADHGMVWVGLGEILQDRYHILAPDLRGHGNSSKLLSGYRCADIIADLEALMAHRGFSSAHVVAYSWSAKVAAVWAKQHPQAIRSLVLVDPFFINPIPRWLKPTFPLLRCPGNSGHSRFKQPAVVCGNSAQTRRELHCQGESDAVDGCRRFRCTPGSKLPPRHWFHSADDAPVRFSGCPRSSPLAL